MNKLKNLVIGLFIFNCCTLAFIACAKEEITENTEGNGNADIHLILNGKNFDQQKVGTYITDSYCCTTQFSFTDNKEKHHGLTIYFKEKINLEKGAICHPENMVSFIDSVYVTADFKGGNASVIEVTKDTLSVLFDNCEFGDKIKLSGILKFAAKEYDPKEFSIQIWGDKHPFQNWLPLSPPYYEGNNLFNVQKTELIVYLPKSPTKTTPMVVICPGGSYTCQATVHEGSDVGEWFAKNGMAAAVLRYCLPYYEHPEIPLSDAQEAIRVLRKKSFELQVDPRQIGVIGFSAGGHLASFVSTSFNATNGIKVAKPALQAESRPDFSILCYPVITMEDPYTHKGSRNNLIGTSPRDELKKKCSTNLLVTQDTPPALIVHAEDDTGVSIENSKLYYNALINNGISAKFITYPTGGHGFGFKTTFVYHDRFMKDILDWMESKPWIK